MKPCSTVAPDRTPPNSKPSSGKKALGTSGFATGDAKFWASVPKSCVAANTRKYAEAQDAIGKTNKSERNALTVRAITKTLRVRFQRGGDGTRPRRPF